MPPPGSEWLYSTRCPKCCWGCAAVPLPRGKAVLQRRPGRRHRSGRWPSGDGFPAGWPPPATGPRLPSGGRHRAFPPQRPAYRTPRQPAVPPRQRQTVPPWHRRRAPAAPPPGLPPRSARHAPVPIPAEWVRRPAVPHRCSGRPPRTGPPPGVPPPAAQHARYEMDRIRQ